MAEIDEPQVYSVKEYLNENLLIPTYQRPYKWTCKNIEDLLGDINDAIVNKEKKKVPRKFRYRIGTVILHTEEQGLSIVDGQQRTISLAILCDVLGHPEYCNSINFPKSKTETFNALNEKTTKLNFNKNKAFIVDWFSSREELKAKFLNNLQSLLEVVVIKVKDQSEAFQLFDSQNSRGKTLDPHDLLKAYHLREMKNNLYEMENAVKKWEEKKSADIRDLFNIYLFPIYNWCNFSKDKDFTVNDIDIYKGVKEDLPYTYVKRVIKTMPTYQISEPYLAGEEFFGYVDHYLIILENIRRTLYEDKAFLFIKNIFVNYGIKNFSNEEILKKKKWLYYPFNLFLCTLLLYYDKFHNFDKTAVNKIFLWSFMIRVDMEKLGYDTINKYAIGGEGNSNYSNHIPMFRTILMARRHTDISNLIIEINQSSGVLEAKGDRWKLQKILRKIKEGEC